MKVRRSIAVEALRSLRLCVRKKPTLRDKNKIQLSEERQNELNKEIILVGGMKVRRSIEVEPLRSLRLCVKNLPNTAW